MPHRTPAPLRAIGVLLRALLGLAILAALVAGVPYLLLTVGHQPTELAGGINLLEQDDGSLFLVVLTCIGWTGWAAFTVSVLVEIVALLRRRSAPRIKGLRSLQSLASFLIGGIVLLAPTAASAATTGPAIAATVNTAGESSSSATPSAKASTPVDDADWPQHTVASATELPWDLAEEYLGDGKRWKDIAALNPEIPQLAAGDQYLPKGAVIKLPADARPAAPAISPAPEASSSPQTKAPKQHTQDQAQDRSGSDSTDGEDEPQRPDSVTVRAGDSLWTIADAHGDPEDWPAIYEANKGEPTPGGGRFNNPNLIYPGQELDLPQAETDAPPADQNTADPKTPENPQDKQDEKPAPETTPKKDADKDTGVGKPSPPAAASTPSRTAHPAPSTAAPAPSTAAPAPSEDSSPTPAPAAQPSSNNDTALAPGAVWAGAGALAAALVGTLATRRILQQRRRRPGRRIPMPAGRAAATEQGLRAAQHPTGFDLLGTALRSLALNLAAAGRELPVIEAVVLHEAKVELHLAQDTAPMKPFTQTAGRTDLWVCPASSPDLADEERLKDADAPYPALVSIGWDGAGHLVLVDLEHVGILNLAGDDDFARHVLQAIAVELASTPLPGHLEVTALADTAPGLDSAAPERVVRIADLANAAADLTGHTDDQRRALGVVGTSSLRAARLTDDAAGAWTPHILLAESLPEGTDRTALFDSLTEEPRAAGAVITASPPAELPATAWTLECQGPDHTIALPGSNLPVKLQGLSDEHFADAIELLILAASDADVPAPDWTHAADDQDDDEQDGPGRIDDAASSVDAAGAEPAEEAEQVADEDAADEDGLPAEYAELEQDAASKDDEPAPGTDGSQEGTSPDLVKRQDEDEDGPQGAPAAVGPSLAEVLAADDEGDAVTAAPKATGTKDDGPGPASGPADVALALTSPCPTPAAPAVHVTIPAPAPAGDTDPAAGDTPTPVAAHSTVAAPPGPAAEAAAAEGPTVLLLGPISIEGASGRIDSSRRSAGIELVTFLALNPGVDHHGIDDALWPGRLVNKQMRNAVISRTRSWLGKDADGQAHLPRVQDTGDSRYRLGPAVTCDWTRFQRFARTGLARHDEDGDLALRRALALVRGRPFTGIAPQRYAWAEPAIQEMVSAVVDVAYELSTRRREADDMPGALWAAKRGLLAAEESEMLHRQIFLAHHAAGDIDALREAAARLARINEQLLGGVDMEAETAELLRNLLPRPVSRAR
ncbi:LysM peptidoglycan-binding domain-containing protein [Streptomyces sp. HNM0663]|uniref:LysM peptidoglycan-binding domain-containing protein n=1 Tax=Streptomyces chengmaiensis TaxID=3040919 RepID=A0ABT6HWI4_9ACTN|nr:LysM peptidoglycan-binding domain-containing protein [Streptomyces chengmaiensis]MDH2392224.1 LysM peptidoglycan-binding domain-containing protein [Streptomyces chengmaiensis]